MSAKIEKGMDFDEWQTAWYELARERGHILKADGDYVNNFVTSVGYCNGPGCIKCGWSECMHCDWQGKKIPTCTGSQP